MDIVYRENVLTADDVLQFQNKMNWTVDPKEQWEKSLRHTIHSVVAVMNDETIAMGRLLGDASIYWYINDVFVLNEHQRKGIGSEIVKHLLEHIRTNGLPGTEVSVCLMCAKDKEPFYEKLGFRSRPHEYEGAGMEFEMKID